MPPSSPVLGVRDDPRNAAPRCAVAGSRCAAATSCGQRRQMQELRAWLTTISQKSRRASMRDRARAPRTPAFYGSEYVWSCSQVGPSVEEAASNEVQYKATTM